MTLEKQPRIGEIRTAKTDHLSTGNQESGPRLHNPEKFLLALLTHFPIKLVLLLSPLACQLYRLQVFTPLIMFPIGNDTEISNI